MTVTIPGDQTRFVPDVGGQPYLTHPSRVGGMCMNQALMTWWMDRVGEVKGCKYLEIGSFDGILLSLMAERFPQGEFYAIDPFEDATNTGGGHYAYWYINNKKFPNVHLYKCRSIDGLPLLLEKGIKFDRIFIDGDHSYETCLFDMQNCWHLLTPGGFMACHDYTHMDGVKQAVTEFAVGNSFEMAQAMPVFTKST